MNKKVISLCSIPVLAMLFSACGGGASSSSMEENSSKDSSFVLSGQALNSYIEGGKVCLDINDNEKCDSDEPFTITGKYGKYKLELSEDQKAMLDGRKSLILESTPESIVVNREGDEERKFTETFIATPFSTTAEKGESVNITSVSTLASKLAKKLIENGKDVTVEDKAFQKSFKEKTGIDLTEQIDYVSGEDMESLNYYKVSNILLKAIQIDNNIGISDFAEALAENKDIKGIENIVNKVLEKVTDEMKKADIKSATDFYNKLDEKALMRKGAIAKKANEILEELKKGKNVNFGQIKVKNLPLDPGVAFFVKADLVGKTYVMYSSDTNKPFMHDVMGDLTFNANGTISSTVVPKPMNYSIDEDGQLVMGAHGTYKKIKTENGKIYFEDISNGKKYYFVKKDNTTPASKIGFKKADLVGKTYNMYNADGSPFAMPTFVFSEDKINGVMPYTIENGILKLNGRSFKKIEDKDGKIWFKDIKTQKKYYFVKADSSDKKSDESTKKETPSAVGFTKDELMGKTFSMHATESNFAMTDIVFKDDNTMTSSSGDVTYKIENGILFIDGAMKMSFEKIRVEDGKIYVKGLSGIVSGKEYYFEVM